MDIHLPSLEAATSFSDPVAVEAWDAWFRWRDAGRVRDADIGATWRRVARALARAEGDAAREWERAFLELLETMRVLPDARIIATAGTTQEAWPADGLDAVLNAAAFVRDPFTPRARLDLGEVSAAAGVAVRMLDDASLLANAAPGQPHRFRIGLIGVADMVLMLGHAYDSAGARGQTQLVAAALAAGCRAASARLARERGAPGCTCAQQPCAEAHTVFRHAQLTAITSQPRLALLANNVADELHPLQRSATHAIDSRVLTSSGSTLAQSVRHSTTPAAGDRSIAAPPAAVAALRAAVQPFMDVPIEVP